MHSLMVEYLPTIKNLGSIPSTLAKHIREKVPELEKINSDFIENE